jgi:hypothetical protein
MPEYSFVLHLFSRFAGRHSSYFFFGFEAAFSAALTWTAQSLRPGATFLVHWPEGNTFRHLGIDS